MKKNGQRWNIHLPLTHSKDVGDASLLLASFPRVIRTLHIVKSHIYLSDFFHYLKLLVAVLQTEVSKV
jgi:hypothetical protein